MDIKPKSRKEKAIQTKNKILNVATKLFLEQDFHKISTQKIATSAKVAKGTVFHHFLNKELLALAVMEKIMEDMLKEFNIMENVTEEILKGLVKHSLEIAVTSPGFVQLFLQLFADKEKLTKKPANEIESKTQEELLHILNLMQNYITGFTEVFSKMGLSSPDIQARLFLGLLDGVGLQIFFDQNPDEALIEQLTDGIVALFTKQEGN